MTRSGDFEFEQSWLVDGPEGSFIEYKYFIVDANGNEMPNDGWGKCSSDPITVNPSSFLNRFLQAGSEMVPIYPLIGVLHPARRFLHTGYLPACDPGNLQRR